MASIDPSKWGPSFWSTLHWTAAGYSAFPSSDEKRAFRQFFEILRSTLPCTDCRKHFTEVLQQHPIDEALVSGKALRKWVVDVHNVINERTGSKVRWTLVHADSQYPPSDASDAVVAPPRAAAATPLVRTALPRPVAGPRVARPTMLHRRIIRPQSAAAAATAPRMLIPTSAVPKKKKGCGCNKKK